MQKVRWAVFLFLYFLRYPRKLRVAFLWIVRELDSRVNREWQPLRSAEKRSAFNVMAREDYFRKYGKYPHPKEVITAREWTLQRDRGPEYRSPYKDTANLAWIYGQKLKKQ